MTSPPPSARLLADQSLADSQVRELASGIDALYLSGRAMIPPQVFEDLEQLRETAIGADRPMPVELDGEVFGVEPRAFGRYRFRLVSPKGMIGVTASDNLPALRVQPRAEFLHAEGPSAVLQHFERVGEYLAGGPVAWGLSRLDLFCDVQGWLPVGDDRHRFVTRARTRTTHEQSESFTGFEFGRRSTKTVCARIYDKTLQVETKGLDWWPTVWGERFDQDKPVLRVEFEFGRKGLGEYQIETPDDGLASAARLWASVTSDWLTLRDPIADQTKARWPVADEWLAVQSASLRSDAIGAERVRAGVRQGELRTLLPSLVGYTASVGAIVGTAEVDSTLGALRMLIHQDERRREVRFSDRVAERVAAREFG